MEISFIQNDQNSTEEFLSEALTMIRDKWEPETTVRNLKMLYESGEKEVWKEDVIQTLDEAFK